MTPEIIIQIPDPLLRQFEGKGPNFIETMPPDFNSMRVEVDKKIILNIDSDRNKDVKNYLAKLEERALSGGFSVSAGNSPDDSFYSYEFNRGGT